MAISWGERSQDFEFKRLANAVRARIDPAFAENLEKADYVDRMVQEFGVGYSNPGEIDELPKTLDEGEEIRYMTLGSCEYKNYKSGTGLWVATDRRLLFLDKGLIGAANYFSIPYGQIKPDKSRVDWEGEVKLYVSDLGKVEMEHIPRENRKRLVDQILAGCGEK